MKYFFSNSLIIDDLTNQSDGHIWSSRSFNVFPKFICFPLPNTTYRDVHAIGKRLLRSAILKRSCKQKKLNQNLCKIENILNSTLSSFDWLILNRSLKMNIEKRIHKIIATHQKKLRNLTKNTALPLSHNETVTNLSSHKLTVMN